MKKITNLLMIACLALFSWQGFAQNGGNDCATAVVISPGTFSDVFITDATAGANQGDANDAIWYSYTPAVDALVSINSCLSDPGGVDTRLFVYTDGCATLTAVDDDDDGCDAPNGFGSSVTDIIVTGGQTYLIEWDDRWEDTNPFDWELIEVTCENPTATISMITDVTAQADWATSFGATNYNWEVVPTGNAQGVGVVMSGTTATLMTAITGLTAENTYDFLISSDCDATYSAAVTFATTASCTNPTNIAIANETTTTADASWDAGLNAANYDWEVVPTGNAQGVGVVASGNTTMLTAAITGLTAGDAYDFIIKSDCAVAYSAPVTFSTVANPPANDECLAAVSLTVNTDLACGSFTPGTIESATDSGISNCGGTEDDDVWYSFVATATSHQVALNNVTNGTTDLYHAVYDAAPGCGALGAALTCSDPNISLTNGLTIGNTYIVQVYSWTSTPNQTSTFDICIGTPPPPPTNNDCASAQALTINAPADCTSTFSVDHSAATGSATNYAPCDTADTTNIDSFYTFTPTGTSVILNVTNGTQTGTAEAAIFDACGGTMIVCGSGLTQTFTGLTAGTTYTMSIWYDDFNTEGSFDICLNTPLPADCATDPVPADDAVAVDIDTNGDIAVTWTAPATGPAPDAYEVFLGTATGVLTSQATVTATTYTFTGLSFTTEYFWQVVPSNQGVAAMSCAEWSFTTEDAPACLTPNMLSVTGITADLATLNWVDPTDPDVGSYEYEVVDVTLSGIPTGTPTGTSTTVTADLTGLTVGNEYQFLVRTVCPDGLGFVRSEYSVAQNWIQTEAPGCSSNPSPIDGDTMTPIGAVTFTWDAPTTGGIAAEYDVYAGDTAALEFGVITTVTATTVDLNVNVPETTLFWSIVPKNAGGEASGCPIWSFTTVAADPSGVDCANAEPVIDGSYQVFLEDVTAGTNNGDSVWFVYTATNLGTINVNSCSGGLDTRLFIYDSCGDFIGHNDGANDPLATNDDAAGCNVNTDGSGSAFASSIDALAVVPGEDYYIQFDDRWSTGVFTWNINLTPECPDSTTWDGAAWSNGAPDATKTAIIDGAYATSTADIDACAIYISAIGSLTVSAGTFARANGSIVNDGFLTVAHTGNVLQVDDLATMTGSGTTLVVVDTPTVTSTGFLVLGSPVATDTREVVWSSAFNVQAFDTSSFVPNADVQASGVAYNFAGTDFTEWNPAIGILSPAEGYLVRPQASYGGAGGSFTYDYAGALNNGVITSAVGFNTTQVNSPNILSNPYASAIDADLFLAANAEIDALYFWNHLTEPSAMIPGSGVVNYSMDDISVYNNMGGTAAAVNGGLAPTNVVSTAQGFGVFASAAGTATFNNSMRLTTGNTTLRASAAARDRIWLNIANAQYSVSGNALVGFTADATAGFDSGFDNTRLGTAISLYSHINTGDDGYGIQGREAFNTDMEVSLGFSSIIEAEASYVISITDLDGAAWDNNDIFLIDNVLNTSTHLNDTDYTFASIGGTFNDRFALQFVDRSVLGTTNADLNAVSLSPNPTNGLVNIASPRALVNNISITDIQGRVVNTISVNGLNSYQLDMSSLRSAVYFVQVTTEAGSITKRLIKR